jgi:hypothetical protein
MDILEEDNWFIRFTLTELDLHLLENEYVKLEYYVGMWENPLIIIEQFPQKII